MVLDALTAPPETLEFTTLSLKSKGRRAEARPTALAARRPE
jgi:hypothetical protein